MIMTTMYCCMKSLTAITNRVGAGSVPPKSVNILEKIGMTQTIRTDTTMMATPTMAVG